MKDEIFRTERERALQLAPKRFDRLLQEWRTSACNIDQIAGVDHEWLQSVLRTKLTHGLALRSSDGVRSPHAGAGGEDLKGVAAQSICAFGRGLGASRCGGVDADTTRSQLWRLDGSR